MSNYIEKDWPGEFFNPTSCTFEVNPNDKVPMNDDHDENLERWKWLTNGWDKMTFKQKMSLFLPMTCFLELRDTAREYFDENINNAIVDKCYGFCRTIRSIKFDPDRKGIPNILLVLNPIDPNTIPVEETKFKVKQWGSKFGFYEDQYY